MKFIFRVLVMVVAALMALLVLQGIRGSSREVEVVEEEEVTPSAVLSRPEKVDYATYTPPPFPSE